MVQSGQAQSGRDERCSWQSQQGQIMESLECQAEDLVLIPRPWKHYRQLQFCSLHTNHQSCHSQAERLLSFTVFVISFPVVGDLSLGSVVSGTRLKAGQVGQNPEPLGLPKSG